MFFKIGFLINFTIFTGKHLCWSPYSVRTRENTDQKNSEYGHFSRSVRNATKRGLHKISCSCTKLIIWKNLKGRQSDQLTSCKAKFLTDNTNFKSKRHRAFFVLFFLVTMQIQPKAPLRSETILITENPLKMMKNAFCFTLKALFVLKIFNFFSCLFVHDSTK